MRTEWLKLSISASIKVWCVRTVNRSKSCTTLILDRYNKLKNTIDNMDTGDLSEESYHAILIESEKFNHDLTLQFGLLSEECKHENEFIEKSVKLIEEMRNYSNVDLDDMFFGNPPKMNTFQTVLNKILQNIEDVKVIPIEKRTYA